MAVNPLHISSVWPQPLIVKICSKVLLVLHHFFVGVAPFVRTAGKEAPICVRWPERCQQRHASKCRLMGIAELRVCVG